MRFMVWTLAATALVALGFMVFRASSDGRASALDRINSSRKERPLQTEFAILGGG